VLNANRCNGNVISICQVSLELAAKLSMVNAGKHCQGSHVYPQALSMFLSHLASSIGHSREI
jgi:hypothetical protein